MNSIFPKLVILSLILINTQVVTAANTIPDIASIPLSEEGGGDKSIVIGSTIENCTNCTISAIKKEEVDGEDYFSNVYAALSKTISEKCKGLTTYTEYIESDNEKFSACTIKINKDLVYLYNGYAPKVPLIESPQYIQINLFIEAIKERYKTITGDDLTQIFESN